MRSQLSLEGGRNGLRLNCRDVDMTCIDDRMEAPLLDDDREPTAAEIEASRRDDFLLPIEEATPEVFPSLYNISAGMLFDVAIRPTEPTQPDYVAIPMDPVTFHGDEAVKLAVGVSQWNLLWEAGKFRRRFFDEGHLPKPLLELAALGDVNVTIVPRTTSRYYEYAPLFHLLPKATLDRFGLPTLRRGQWPFLTSMSTPDLYLPTDFEDRLARAWAATVWPHLVSGSWMKAFSKDDPVRLLAHNLDYWVPPVTTVMQDLLRSFPLVEHGAPVGPARLEDGSMLEGAVFGNPRMGGDLWTGEEDAAEMVAETVEAADSTGQLRGILDAVKAHRVADDFSDAWSYAKEDFERKLYRRRNKVQVRFVELTDTIPVQGPESEAVGNVVTSDFLALLDAEQREVVVLLTSGYRQHEIAEQLGYANHSPISKKLAQIRRQAAAFFGND